MKQLFATLVLVILSSAAVFGQLTITSTTPSSGTTGLPLSTTVSITFSAPLNETWALNSGHGIFTNVSSVGTPTYSLDKRTISFPVTLIADKVHFFLVSYAKAQDGTAMTVPYGFYFTSASSLPSATVSGTVVPGSPGLDPGRCLVVLASDQEPDDKDLVIGTVADVSGAFTIPYVADGGYYPLAAKDMNNDGSMETSDGDALGFADSITVTGSNITGLMITLRTFPPLLLHTAIDSVASIVDALPSDRSLRLVSSWDIDSVGRSGDWQFDYILPSLSMGVEVMAGSMYNDFRTMDAGRYSWMVGMKPFTNLVGAAASSTFLANVEAAGGRAYRYQAHPDSMTFQAHTYLGDLAQSELWALVTDNTKLYWGAVYSWGVQSDTNYQQYKPMLFLGDYFSGAILKTTDVQPSDAASVPDRMTLSQNYPNPFNPSTMIAFSLPAAGQTSLKIYNLMGQEVSTLIDGKYERGNHKIRFDASNLPSGMYFCVLRSNGSTLVEKIALVK